MYRTVLVDDEPWSLESMLQLIDWNALGYETPRVFNDSEAALDYILCERPDLVFTDIRMPVLSGIELMRRARAAGQTHSAFVIVSGYGEFSYAQEALSLGAYNYLLKPVDEEELTDMLRKLDFSLRRGVIERDVALLRALDAGEDPASLLIPRGLPVQGEHFQVYMLIHRPEFQRRCALPAALPGVLLSPAEDRCLLILRGDAGALEQAQNALIACGAAQHSYTGQSSEIGHSDAIPQLIREAEIAADQYLISPVLPGSIVTYQPKPLDIVNRFIEVFKSRLSADDISAAMDALGSISEMLQENALNMLHAVYLYNELAAALSHRYPDEALSIRYMDVGQLRSSFASMRDVSLYFQSILSGASGKACEEENNAYLNNNFEKLLRYVDAHFHERLSLKDLAGEYFLGFTYCCHLFKRVTGKTFNEYLLTKRMQKAYELMETGRFTVEQAAAQTGYEDPYYFTRKFKKYFGISPSSLAR